MRRIYFYGTFFEIVWFKILDDSSIKTSQKSDWAIRSWFGFLKSGVAIGTPLIRTKIRECPNKHILFVSCPKSCRLILHTRIYNFGVQSSRELLLCYLRSEKTCDIEEKEVAVLKSVNCPLPDKQKFREEWPRCGRRRMGFKCFLRCSLGRTKISLSCGIFVHNCS